MNIDAAEIVFRVIITITISSSSFSFKGVIDCDFTFLTLVSV